MLASTVLSLNCGQRASGSVTRSGSNSPAWSSCRSRCWHVSGWGPWPCRSPSSTERTSCVMGSRSAGFKVFVTTDRTDPATPIRSPLRPRRWGRRGNPCAISSVFISPTSPTAISGHKTDCWTSADLTPEVVAAHQRCKWLATSGFQVIHVGNAFGRSGLCPAKGGATSGIPHVRPVEPALWGVERQRSGTICRCFIVDGRVEPDHPRSCCRYDCVLANDRAGDQLTRGAFARSHRRPRRRRRGSGTRPRASRSWPYSFERVAGEYDRRYGIRASGPSLTCAMRRTTPTPRPGRRPRTPESFLAGTVGANLREDGCRAATTPHPDHRPNGRRGAGRCRRGSPSTTAAPARSSAGDNHTTVGLPIDQTGRSITATMCCRTCGGRSPTPSTRPVCGTEQLNAIETHDCMTPSSRAIDHFGIRGTDRVVESDREGQLASMDRHARQPERRPDRRWSSGRRDRQPHARRRHQTSERHGRRLPGRWRRTSRHPQHRRLKPPAHPRVKRPTGERFRANPSRWARFRRHGESNAHMSATRGHEQLTNGSWCARWSPRARPTLMTPFDPSSSQVPGVRSAPVSDLSAGADTFNASQTEPDRIAIDNTTGGPATVAVRRPASSNHASRSSGRSMVTPLASASR